MCDACMQDVCTSDCPIHSCTSTWRRTLSTLVTSQLTSHPSFSVSLPLLPNPLSLKFTQVTSIRWWLPAAYVHGLGLWLHESKTFIHNAHPSPQLHLSCIINTTDKAVTKHFRYINFLSFTYMYTFTCTCTCTCTVYMYTHIHCILHVAITLLHVHI